MLFTFCFMTVPHDGHAWDMNCWRVWADYIFINGLGNIYNSGTDYLPLFHYILKAFGNIQGSIKSIDDNIYYLKLITLIFDFILGFFIALTIKKKENTWDNVLLNTILFYLLNLPILYNTIIWGQVDAILTCFIFISCYFAFKKRILLSLIFIIFAINFKLQAIIFLPIIGLMILPVIVSTFSTKNLAKWVLLPLLLQLLIILPFIIAKTTDNLWYTVTNSVGKYPQVSMNAYNIWDLFLPGKDLRAMTDRDLFMKMSFNHWGLLMFFISSGIALFPLTKYVYLSLVRNREWDIPLEIFLITCTLIPLLFFYFNTQMHERYSHPTFAFLITYALYKKRPIVAAIGCLAYFLNLEGVLHYLQLYNYKTLVFNRTFISSLFLLTIILLTINLFNLKLKKEVKTTPIIK